MDGDRTMATEHGAWRRRGLFWIIVAAITVAVGAMTYLWHAQRQHRQRRAEILTVLGNLRKIDSGIDQYRLNTGRYPTALSDIVGPGKIISSLHRVPGVDYRSVNVAGEDLLRARMADGTEVLYSRATGTWANPFP
jgi:hypothetical protein